MPNILKLETWNPTTYLVSVVIDPDLDSLAYEPATNANNHDTRNSALIPDLEPIANAYKTDIALSHPVARVRACLPWKCRH